MPMADTTTRKRVSAKDPEAKLAHRRLTVLELAQKLCAKNRARARPGYPRTMRADLITAWLQQQPTGERPDTFRRNGNVTVLTNVARAGQAIHFPDPLAQRRHVEHLLGQ
jgi:hypothetical protein